MFDVNEILDRGKFKARQGYDEWRELDGVTYKLFRNAGGYVERVQIVGGRAIYDAATKEIVDYERV